MGLLQDWREYAYGVEINSKAGKAIWDKYFKEEKAIYEKLLANPSDIVTGTVRELAEKYGMELNYMVGFLDGINESLKEPNPIEDMTADTVVKLDSTVFPSTEGSSSKAMSALVIINWEVTFSTFLYKSSSARLIVTSYVPADFGLSKGAPPRL